MPTNVVLNTKTYTFASDQNGVITWYEQSGGVPTGFGVLTCSLRPPAGNDQYWRATIKLETPVVAEADSACTCDGSVLRKEDFNITVRIPNSGSSAERLDNALRFADLAADTQIQAMLSSLTRP